MGQARKIKPQDLVEWAAEDFRPADIPLAKHRAVCPRTEVEIELGNGRLALACFECRRVWAFKQINHSFVQPGETRKFVNSYLLSRSRPYQIIEAITWKSLNKRCDVGPLTARGVLPGRDPQAAFYAVRFSKTERGYLLMTGDGHRYLFGPKSLVENS